MKYELDDIKRLLVTPRWNIKHKVDDWFFPSDLIPFSTALKYSCKKLWQQGKLERSESCGRWGYDYRIKPEAAEGVANNSLHSRQA